MTFGIDFWALTMEFVGTMLIALAVLKVHYKLRREGKVDKKVLKEIRFERGITILGILMIFIGYVLHLMVLI